MFFNLCAWQSFYALSNMCIVNVDNFAQDIFSHILRSTLNAKKNVMQVKIIIMIEQIEFTGMCVKI